VYYFQLSVTVFLGLEQLEGRNLGKDISSFLERQAKKDNGEIENRFSSIQGLF